MSTASSVAFALRNWHGRIHRPGRSLNEKPLPFPPHSRRVRDTVVFEIQSQRMTLTIKTKARQQN